MNQASTRRFEGRTALITGAAGGIGSATARRLAHEGARLVLADLPSDAFDALAGELGARAVPLDVTDESAIASCVAQIGATEGRLDVLCNNAGLLGGLDPADAGDAGDWRQVLEVNLLGAATLTRHAAALLRAARGCIVNTASVAGIRSGAGGNAYSASKAGLINFTMTAACDFGAAGIRVNAVCPGLIETGMTRPVFDHARATGKEDRLGARCELRRYGRPEEVASVIAFLASDDASYITGQAIAVDGGNTASLNLPGMKF
ncbi:SDR family NAD(P)-dependent oxidoreductase [Profundibacterium mesophilum]|uniref:3-oxoacyl-acyl-carrier protein reductase n=1 Tax=Profundibacterium mesophilum KAUST100406-0324 TaxID=1037889 RepID=A0A921NN82_9RHOB|nr:SDR family NAD(P)-dependent oxidoreductase [Profundibacterium mesophilum]KAF0674616.1 putative 3-oxoacyl-acyl-carrier protein reductase [Profundibacterium mesophilum KAUST100406-0324]